MPARATPLIIDVDTGIDDAFALLYACASPRARLVGVSTVAGNVDLASATRNTQRRAGARPARRGSGLAGLRGAAAAGADMTRRGSTARAASATPSCPSPHAKPRADARDRRDPRRGARRAAAR